MPAYVTLRFAGQAVSGRNPSVTNQYTVYDAATKEDALAALAAGAASSEAGMPQESVLVSPLAPNIWSGEVRYSRARPGSSSTPYTDSDTAISFSTGGGTEHITVALEQTPYGDDAPAFGNMINVVGSGRDAVAQGVDIFVPQYRWTETVIKSNATVTQSYRNTIAALTATTNNSTFRGFAAGEVLFLGADGSRSGTDEDEDKWTISFHFAASQNKTGLTIDGIEGVTKGAWDVLWAHSTPKSDGGNKTDGVYKSRVYESGNFGSLGI